MRRTPCALAPRRAGRPAHLKDDDVSIDFSEVTADTDRVSVIATTPLTDNEAWTRIAPGTLMLFRAGEPVETRHSDQMV